MLVKYSMQPVLLARQQARINGSQLCSVDSWFDRHNLGFVRHHFSFVFCLLFSIIQSLYHTKGSKYYWWKHTCITLDMQDLPGDNCNQGLYRWNARDRVTMSLWMIVVAACRIMQWLSWHWLRLTTSCGKHQFIDKFDFTLSGSGDSCVATACSDSQVLSMVDYSTNFCKFISSLLLYIIKRHVIF